LEEAELVASRDALTHLGNRLWVEGQIEFRIAAGRPFCVAILDIDEFKRVNDQHGHVVGDELLRQFARELRSACRSTDVIGRWGGDEFIVLLDGGLAEAKAQIDRVSKWVCGNYTVPGGGGPTKISVRASIGVAEYAAETMKEVLDRADSEMYRHKAATRRSAKSVGR
jgi:diguanylate cyclase (GGDEF)-like protein